MSEDIVAIELTRGAWEDVLKMLGDRYLQLRSETREIEALEETIKTQLEGDEE